MAASQGITYSATGNMATNHINNSLNRLYKNRSYHSKGERKCTWTVRDSQIVNDASSDEMRRYLHLIKPSFSNWKRKRREMYAIVTFHGSLLTWGNFFQPIILVASITFWSVTLSGMFSIHFRRFFNTRTETLEMFEWDAEYMLQITAAVVGLIMVIYGLPNVISRITSSESNRVRRIQFRLFMQRLAKFNPFMDMHDLDYNSDQDPVQSFLYFQTLPLARSLIRDEIYILYHVDHQELRANSKTSPIFYDHTIHPHDCDCLEYTSKKEQYNFLEDYQVFKDQIRCQQKMEVVLNVIDKIKNIEYNEYEGDDEYTLIENIACITIQCYEDVLKNAEYGDISTVRGWCKLFSCNPPTQYSSSKIND